MPAPTIDPTPSSIAPRTLMLPVVDVPVSSGGACADINRASIPRSSGAMMCASRAQVCTHPDAALVTRTG